VEDANIWFKYGTNYFHRQYSPSYYRATWINTGLDAGFATAMAIRPKWLNDFCSVLFSVYYVVYAQEADEKVSGQLRGQVSILTPAQLRRFRAVPTVEMLRTTWEKTTNPYVCVSYAMPCSHQCIAFRFASLHI
jgi:hypothetical protein